MPKTKTPAPGTGELKKPKVPVKVPARLVKGAAKGLTAKNPVKVSTSPPKDKPSTAIDKVDTSFLQTLMGYNARRAALSIIELFLERLAPYGLKPVDFSVMSTIQHNPGVTSRQLCATLNLLPPNLVGLIQSLESRGLIERKPHPHDGRAVGLHASPKGQALMVQAEQAASELEIEKTAKLTPSQRQTLLTLLQKIYL
ncbi:MarR family winged helix-turn-helix transcriptional regulator [Limnohabitans sp. 2KL-17]|uniref:MarR family winged helix-turn-helix transcriptional regulator n=1 Tax=Limnohabitans sp. 2KL-17 TaxID=1100704 RepID=UPI00269D5960